MQDVRLLLCFLIYLGLKLIRRLSLSYVVCLCCRKVNTNLGDEIL